MASSGEARRHVSGTAEEMAVEPEKKSEACSSLPPAYTDTAGDSQLEFLKRVAADYQRDHASRVSRMHPGAASEADRLRRFLRFSIAVDYQDDCSAHVGAEDRAHFATLLVLLEDLSTLDNSKSLSLEDGEAIGPYFRCVFFQPCRVLQVPPSLVVGYLWRFFQYQGSGGNYQGSMERIPSSQGMEGLAQKLVTDREIMIPRIIQEPYMRERFDAHIEQVTRLYFSSLKGIDSSTVLSRQGLRPEEQSARWQAEYSFSYELNDYGRAFTRATATPINKDEGNALPPISTWIQRAKEGLEMIRSRRQKQPVPKTAACPPQHQTRH